MTPFEREIAHAALRPSSAPTYDEFWEEVAERVGASIEEVEEAISFLTTALALTDKYVQILHPTPRIEGPAKIPQEWYVKGPSWDLPDNPVLLL